MMMAPVEHLECTAWERWHLAGVNCQQSQKLKQGRGMGRTPAWTVSDTTVDD
jgi:hypothetical protein